MRETQLVTINGMEPSSSMVMTILQTLNTAGSALATVSDTPRLDAEILLSHVLNKSRTYLITWPDKRLSETEAQAFQRLLNLRLQGRPIAYITGTREFWSLPLKVTPDVLIPRPDTELLVETTLQLLPQKNTVKIADLGTGSGAIAIALAYERPEWQVTAIDQSPAALAIARENATMHRLNIQFVESDWFSALPGLKFHAIVSNPPYIAEQDPHLQMGDVRFEPTTALISKQDGLADLSKLIHSAKEYLLPQGWLLLEHGYQQAEPVRKLMQQAGYRNIQQARDLAGIVRVTYAQI